MRTVRGAILLLLQIGPARDSSKFANKGDTIVITRVDRLARSMHGLQNTVHELKSKGVALKATEQPINTSTAAGKAFFDMLGVFAEFETNFRRVALRISRTVLSALPGRRSFLSVIVSLLGLR